MTTALDLLDLVQQALLTANTSAGTRVLKPGDWPAWDSQYPVLKLRVTRESKVALAASGPAEFTATTTISVLGEVSGFASADDGGAAAVEDALWALAREVEVAVIGSYPLQFSVQEWAAVRSALNFSSEGEKHLASITIEIDLVTFQGSDQFAQIPTDDLDDVDVAATNYSPTGATITLDQ